jgi:hypothetical protein
MVVSLVEYCLTCFQKICINPPSPIQGPEGEDPDGLPLIPQALKQAEQLGKGSISPQEKLRAKVCKLWQHVMHIATLWIFP